MSLRGSHHSIWVPRVKLKRGIMEDSSHSFPEPPLCKPTIPCPFGRFSRDMVSTLLTALSRLLVFGSGREWVILWVAQGRVYTTREAENNEPGARGGVPRVRWHSALGTDMTSRLLFLWPCSSPGKHGNAAMQTPISEPRSQLWELFANKVSILTGTLPGWELIWGRNK